MRKRRILIIAPHESEHTARWIHMLERENKYEIYYIAFKKEWRPVKHSIYIPLKKHIPYKLNLIMAWHHVRKYVKAIQPDIIHAHYLHPYGLFTLGIKKPVIISFWGSDITTSYSNADKITKYLLNRSINGASHIFTVGEHLIDMLDSIPKRYSVIIWGIDTKTIGSINHKLREKYGFEAKDVIILSIRIMRDIFQIERIISAYEHVKAKNKNAKLILIRGPFDEYNKLIENRIKGVEGISVLPMMNNKLFLDIIRMSDIGLTLAVKDGSPVSVKESMGIGLPLIYQDIDALESMLKDRETGVAVKGYSIEELIEKIEMLTDNKALYNRIAGNATRFAFDNLDEKTQFKKALNIYRCLLS